MLRRIVWMPLCALLLALGGSVEAQQPKKLVRLAYLAAVSAAADAPRLEAFRQGLRELGYIEGQNLVIEFRHESGGFERLPALAAELVGQKPDVLVAVTTNAVQAAKHADHDHPHRVHGRDGPGHDRPGGQPCAAGGQHHGHHEHGRDLDQ